MEKTFSLTPQEVRRVHSKNLIEQSPENTLRHSARQQEKGQ